MRLLRSTHEDNKKVPLWERDAEKGEFQGTLDEYSEMGFEWFFFQF
jgi:hypothetical protein